MPPCCGLPASANKVQIKRIALLIAGVMGDARALMLSVGAARQASERLSRWRADHFASRTSMTLSFGPTEINAIHQHSQKLKRNCNISQQVLKCAVKGTLCAVAVSH